MQYFGVFNLIAVTWWKFASWNTLRCNVNVTKQWGQQRALNVCQIVHVFNPFVFNYFHENISKHRFSSEKFNFHQIVCMGSKIENRYFDVRQAIDSLHV